MEEESTHKIFKKYFTEAKVQTDLPKKILKISEQFGQRNKQMSFLRKFFDSLTKCFDTRNPKGCSTMVKRFLYIIHQLLERGQRGRYCEAISKQIVRYYLFFFSNIFKHSLLDLFIELKLYRMKWAKSISDSAFNELRQEIIGKHKFNLDKGFTEQNLTKLRKFHLKKGLTEKQSDFYLGVQERTIETTLRQGPESSGFPLQSSDSESEGPYQETNRKKVKIDPSHSYNNQYQYQYSIHENQKIPVAIEYRSSETPQYSGMIHHNPNLNYYHPQPHMDENHHYMEQDSYIPHNNAVYHGALLQKKIVNQQNFAYPSEINNSKINQYSEQLTSSLSNAYENPIIENPYEMIKSKETKDSRDPKEQREPIELKKDSKVFDCMEMLKKLTNNMLFCKQCGQVFEIKSMYESHVNKHFSESLEQTVVLDIKAKKKCSPPFQLLEIKTWQQITVDRSEGHNFEVSLSQIGGGTEENKICYFCNERLELDWSVTGNGWAYKDCVKIASENHLNLMHYECYESFKLDEDSPISN